MIMISITDAQKELLLRHLPKAQQSIDGDDIKQILEDLDDKITEVGFDANYDLNATGLKLQRLYDELYDQN